MTDPKNDSSLSVNMFDLVKDSVVPSDTQQEVKLSDEFIEYPPLHYMTFTKNQSLIDYAFRKRIEYGAIHDADFLGNTAYHWAAVLGQDHWMDRLASLGAVAKPNHLLGTPQDLKVLFSRPITIDAPDRLWVQMDTDEPVEWLRIRLENKTKFTYHRHIIADRTLYNFCFLHYQNLDDLFEEIAKFNKWEDPKMAPDLNAKIGKKWDSLLAQPHRENRFYLKYRPAPLGWGLFARKNLEKYEIIDQYGGHLGLVTDQNLYKMSCPIFTRQEGLSYDAADTGCLTRFVNHQPPDQANVRLVSIIWKGISHVLLMANREIQAGEELTYNYGDKYWTNKGETPISIQ